MALTQSQISQRINRHIQNAKGKLGGDPELMIIMNDAMRELELVTDFISLKRTSVPVLVFQGVYEYPAPVDIQYDKLIQVYFEKDNPAWPVYQFEKTTPKFLFNRRNPYRANAYTYGSSSAGFGPVNAQSGTSWQNNIIQVMGVEFENNQPYFEIRITEDLTAPQITNCDTFDGNGTWTALTSTTNIRSDNQRYKESSGSVAFDSDGTLVDVTIRNTTLDQVDLSEIAEKGFVTFQLEIPPTILPDSVRLRWGSDTTNYYELTTTVKQNGLPFIAGWNLLGFNWANATTVGSPNDSAMDYVEITITNPTATVVSGYRIDDIVARFGKECTLKYYSKYSVVDINGVRKEQFTASDDSTMLETEEVDMLIDKASSIANRELRQYKEAEIYDIALMQKKQAYDLKMPTQQEIESLSYYLM